MSGAQVLIIADDPALPEALQLRIEGLTVETSDSAYTLLDRIATTEFDALVVDITLPGVDGLKLLAEIRLRRSETPTLLITGRADHELAVQALRGGAYDYVTKPIDHNYLVASLSRAIDCHRQTREAASRRPGLACHAEHREACLQGRVLELREALHREQEARAELARVKARLEAMSRQREDFISLMAHKLAGPLTTIRGYSELLGSSNTVPEVQERARALIISETDRIARVAEDLADVAHAPAGRSETEA